jgi:electron transport complex protein RnfD
MTTATATTESAATPVIHVAPGPHVASRSLTTRRMMIDVMIGLAPIAAVALWVFGPYALKQMAVCMAACVAAEALFTKMRSRPLTLTDGSAAVTGLILAFSIPATTPWWIAVIGSFSAIGLGKIVFGGVGMNIFNPAMVGRAFIMLAFTWALGAGGYVASEAPMVTDAMTQATPMTLWSQPESQATSLLTLLIGNTNGSLGETSALAAILGGLYLCLRRTASWEMPAGAIVGLAALAGINQLTASGDPFTVLHHLLGGAFLFGAFFIITDPVSSPLTPKGKFIYGLVFGVLVMCIRLLTPYPEGVMFSVLLVNAITPLINRWTIPRPLGGPVPVKE